MWKKSLLQFEAGSISRFFISCWTFLLLALADNLALLVQSIPSQIQVLTVIPKSSNTGSEPAKCILTTARASILNTHLLPTHLGWTVQNWKSPETQSRDSQAALLDTFPMRPCLFVLPIDNLYCNCSTLPLQHTRSHRWYTNRCTELCFNKTFFQKTGSG